MGVLSQWKASIREAYTTGDTKWVRISIIVCFAQLISISILEGILIHLHTQEIDHLASLPRKFENERQSKEIEANIKNAHALTVYFALYIVAQLFQVYLCLDATYNKNTIQVIALAIFNLCVFGYSVTQVIQRERIIKAIDSVVVSDGHTASAIGSPRVFQYVLIAVAGLFALAICFLAYRLYRVYGWSIYKKIGADMGMRRIYRTYQIFIVFLKVDVFFFLAFSVQYLKLVIQEYENTTEMVVHIVVSLCVTMVTLTLAFIAVRREYRVGMYLFLLGVLGLFVYFIIKLYQIHTPTEYLVWCDFACPPERPECSQLCTDKFGNSRIVLSMFLVLDLILDAVTGIVAYMALRNFGCGLKFHLTKQPSSIGMVNLDGQDHNKRWSLM